jgi:hypothetical protein
MLEENAGATSARISQFTPLQLTGHSHQYLPMGAFWWPLLHCAPFKHGFGVQSAGGSAAADANRRISTVYTIIAKTSVVSVKKKLDVEIHLRQLN